jgi:hypothetical protein
MLEICVLPHACSMFTYLVRVVLVIYKSKTKINCED